MNLCPLRVYFWGNMDDFICKPNGRSFVMSQPDREMPDDMPIVRAPIDTNISLDVVAEEGLDLHGFVDSLNEIASYVAEHARDITVRNTPTYVDDPVIMRKTIQQHLYVAPDEWEEIGTELDLSVDHRRAAKEAHDRESRRLEAETDWYDRSPELETHDVLAMSPPVVQDLIEGGLSPRQAHVQVARMAGKSHEHIGQMMGMAPGTVKSHCHRIDRKIDRAERLLDAIERLDRQTA